MTDLVLHQPSNDLTADMDYARVISAASMLPQSYRGKPADVLVAMGLGKSMGLSPAESLYRIHVIQGRPTASAELIAANVRRAGHRLRVKGDETSARAVIIRSDDPDFEFESVWNIDRARKMGLLGKDGWQKQPGTMMRWRAITEVARLACPEALYGVAYVAEELDDAPRTPTAHVTSTPLSAADFQTDTGAAEPPATSADAVEASSADGGAPAPVSQETGEAITDGQRRALFAAFGSAGFTNDARSAEGRAQRLAYIGQVLGRDVESTNDLTSSEASQVIDALNDDAQDALFTGEQS